MIKHFFTPLAGSLRTIWLLFGLFSGLYGCAGVPTAKDFNATGVSGEPYLGIGVGPAPGGEGVKVIKLRPGPVSMALQKNVAINIQQDVLIKIDEIAVDVDSFAEIVTNLVPSRQVILTFSKAGTQPTSAKSLGVVVGNKHDWLGPIDKANKISPARRYQALPEPDQDTALARVIREYSKRHALTEPIQDLHGLFYQWQQHHHGYHSLSRVLYPFRQPYDLVQLEQTITNPLVEFANDPALIFNEIAHNLDLAEPALPDCAQSQPDLDRLFAGGQLQLDLALKKFDGKQLQQLSSDLEYLLSELSQRRLLAQQLQPDRSLRAMNASMQIDYPALLQAATAFACLLPPQTTLPEAAKTTKLPAQLQESIQGEIAGVYKLEQGWLVFGGNGDNKYDMADLVAVIDPSGNDTYFSSSRTPGRLKLVLDRQGNDRYLTDNGGPGSAWLGVSVLVDTAGNDSYVGKLAANAAGMMGIGILIDVAGRDEYHGDYFSNGAAFYGAGLLLDLGNDADSYRSHAFSQGLGGPRGFGLIYDEGGNDLYLANYQVPSVYGTPAVYAGFSQGFGFGIREFDSGGIGIILDNAGDDRYDGGEFSQGGAYYWGLGILHDKNGNDRYEGNRYSQGFGVHQATGILSDERGNDSYLGMTAACQGAAWDVALGLLIDKAGDDSYRGDNLCQGAAAMQAQAWLIDLQGQDHYSANNNAAQGRAGGSRYHYDPEKPVYNWSLLLDAAGDPDFYSSGRRNNSVEASAAFNEQQPESSQAYGLFLDLAEDVPVLED